MSFELKIRFIRDKPSQVNLRLDPLRGLPIRKREFVSLTRRACPGAEESLFQPGVTKKGDKLTNARLLYNLVNFF